MADTKDNYQEDDLLDYDEGEDAAADAAATKAQGETAKK